MPTVCDLIDVKVPKNDGQSMLPLLIGAQTTLSSRILYWEFGEQGGKQSVLQGDWKLVRIGLENPAYELYNVVEDPSEEINQLALCPEKVATLKVLLKSIPDERSPFKDA